MTIAGVVANQERMVEDVFRAMLAASPALTPEEVDELCRKMWPDGWQWKREYNPTWDEHAEKIRELDRVRFRAFLTSIQE